MLTLVCLMTTAETVKRMVITKNGGEQIAVLLSEEPTISFDKEDPSKMVITTTSSVFNVKSTDLNKMQIEEYDPASIAYVNADNGVDVKCQNDAFMVTASAPGAKLTVYTTGGTEVMSSSLPVGTSIYPLNNFPKGVLVVKVNNQTFKITRR